MLLDWVVEKASWQNVTIFQKPNTLLLFLNQNGPKWIFDQKCSTAYEYNRQEICCSPKPCITAILLLVILVSTRILHFSIVREDLVELILFLIEKSCSYHDTSFSWTLQLNHCAFWPGQKYFLYESPRYKVIVQEDIWQHLSSLTWC